MKLFIVPWLGARAWAAANRASVITWLVSTLPATTAAGKCGRSMEPSGTFNGITFYDDSIATVPDATLAALEALGPDVQTLILGGHERNLDFTEFGARLPENIKTVILFPPTGERIWKAIQENSQNASLPSPFPVTNMEEAVRIAYAKTEPGKICLLSPASPSFGIFKDYRERGDSFKTLVRDLSKAGDNR